MHRSFRASSSYATITYPVSFTSFANQDRIAEAVLCCEEALRRRHEVVPDTRDDTDSFHLFATSVGYMTRSGATVTRWGTSARFTG